VLVWRLPATLHQPILRIGYNYFRFITYTILGWFIYDFRKSKDLKLLGEWMQNDLKWITHTRKIREKSE
jgi:hypothetical protein